jgi:hypothetical protein
MLRDSPADQVGAFGRRPTRTFRTKLLRNITAGRRETFVPIRITGYGSWLLQRIQLHDSADQA